MGECHKGSPHLRTIYILCRVPCIEFCFHVSSPNSAHSRKVRAVGSSASVPATHVGDRDRVPGSCLWFGPDSALGGICSRNQQWLKALSLKRKITDKFLHISLFLIIKSQGISLDSSLDFFFFPPQHIGVEANLSPTGIQPIDTVKKQPYSE